MIRRLATFCLTVMALLAVFAPAAVADPSPPAGNLPPGFPVELRQYVAGTPEFAAGPWFHDPTCAEHGGNVGMYVNAVMAVEPRLLYWSASPDARKQFWSTGGSPNPNADPNREPPNLPPTFPASAADRAAYAMPTDAGACADTMRSWGNPANNAWGFTWVSAADPDTVELMKKQPPTYPADLPVAQFTNACGDQKSPYCAKAFFVDCSRVVMSPDQHPECQRWDVAVAHLFSGMAAYIANNTTWQDKLAQFFGLVGTSFALQGKMFLDGFNTLISPVTTAVRAAQFIANPASAVDDLANSLHDAVTGFTTVVLQGLASVGNFDPASPWFLATYAAGAGIGLVVMAFMSILMILRTVNGGGGREDLQQALFRHLPLGVFLAVFAPAIAAVLTDTVQQLTNGIAAWDAGYLADAIIKVTNMLAGVTVALLPGGSILGIILFLLTIIGTFLLFIGLAMQSIALPLAGVVAGIGWGMWVHPKWRPKALRVPMTFLGVLFSKALLFFLLGVIFAMISGTLSEPAVKVGGLPLLTQMITVAVAFIVMGLAPFSLLKHAPLLPTAADSHDNKSAPGFGTAAVVGAGMGALDSHVRSRGAGNQGSGGEGGQHRIQQTYSQQQQGQSRQPPQQRTAPAGSGSGANTGGGSAAAAATRGGGAGAGAARGGAAAAGTTGGAAATGAAAGALGPLGVAAQIGVAAANKARQAAHDRHAVDVNDDVIKGDK